MSKTGRPECGILFDLDGTLLDTQGDISSICNAVFKSRGIDEVAHEEFRNFIGKGIGEAVRRAYCFSVGREPDAEFLKELTSDFFERYKQAPTANTKPYPGIPEMLSGLKEAGVWMAVTTNKARPIALEVIESMFPADTFAVVAGPDAQTARKPDPQMVMESISASGLPAEAFCYVGDSLVDLATAQNAGVPFIAVSWGYESIGVLEQAGAGIRVEDATQLYSRLVDRNF